MSNVNGSFNTATGMQALIFSTDGDSNTACGFQALFSNDTGSNNTAVGRGALLSNENGAGNTATGFGALGSSTGSDNTAVGRAAGSTINGNSNIAVGVGAGDLLTTGDHNIDIGNEGVALDAGITRIGDSNTQFTVIAGIAGVQVGTDAVFVEPTGQLGTGVPSSARFKTEIKPMEKASEAILALNPVTFRYKKEIDPKGTLRFGLVAEDVVKIDPDLVGRDAKDQVSSVRYDAVNAMLLNEFLKEHRTVQEQEKKIEALEGEMKEQKALMQKVSAQLEVSKALPQTVLNNR
jgi:hypothetical protein